MSNKKSSGGIGFSGVLFVVFLVLKLTDNIDWSWWWVTAPLWLPLTAVISFLGLAALFLFALDSMKGK